MALLFRLPLAKHIKYPTKMIHKIFKKKKIENNLNYKSIYNSLSSFTMMPEDGFYANLELAERVKSIQGCVVECGVWRGGMIAGVSRVLGSERDYYLFDSFEGLPPAKPIDGEGALKWQNDKTSINYFDNCAAPQEFAEQAMKIAGAKSFHLIKGWFNESLNQFNPQQQIALLRLDGDWYESTMICLQVLFPHVAPGGLIIIDDYYIWDGCSRATHDFLSGKSAVERINCFKNICFIQKKPLD
jgi:O-methyltransferase